MSENVWFRPLKIFSSAIRIETAGGLLCHLSKKVFQLYLSTCINEFGSSSNYSCIDHILINFFCGLMVRIFDVFISWKVEIFPRTLLRDTTEIINAWEHSPMHISRSYFSTPNITKHSLFDFPDRKLVTVNYEEFYLVCSCSNVEEIFKWWSRATVRQPSRLWALDL